MAPETINIEVVYAEPDRQTLTALQLPAGSNAQQAITASSILDQHPQIDLTRQKIGIFGVICKLEQVLRDGDRVEIYRPLQHDPMTARRNRLQKK